MCRLLVVSILLVASAAAVAAGNDRDQPVHIEAAQCQAGLETRDSSCKGDVVVTQGTTRLQGEEIKARQDQEDHLYVQGAGKPVRFRQQMEKDKTWVQGEAERFDYDGKIERLRLFDRAWVKHEKDEVRAEVLIYDIPEKFAEAPGKPGTRVYMVVQPK